MSAWSRIERIYGMSLRRETEESWHLPLTLDVTSNGENGCACPRTRQICSTHNLRAVRIVASSKSCLLCKG